MRVIGRVIAGLGAWRPRIEQFPDVFLEATGESLFPGTLNVELDKPLSIHTEFVISGARIGEPEQDMLFESCLINGIGGWRLRPFQPATGLGGHGDHILEIVSTTQLRPLIADLERVVVEFPKRAGLVSSAREA
jgi:CTP-dependent riboflavin kinase